jgi:DNA gyrase/topoisomerase IV subunit B
MSEDFKVLTDREHVLKRAGVYVGSTTLEPISGIINYAYQTKNIVPALIKCVEEIFQNSIDEYIRTEGKFATKISLDIDNTLDGVEITVADTGRGIPLDKIGDSYRPVLAWTELRAGSNFDDSKRTGAGTNGMGAALVNIFSKSFIGTSCDGKNKITVTCSDNMQNIDYKIIKSPIRGTTVKFIPDLEKFGLQEFTADHYDIIADRIKNLAILYPGISFKVNHQPVEFKNIKTIAKKYHESAVSVESDNISLVFAPSGQDEEFRCLSYVNGIYIKNGGAHVDFIMNKVIDNLRTVITKKHKIEILPNAIRQHLLFASWISGFPALKFDSQSKERVTNSITEISNFVKDIDFDKISKQILNTPDILDPMIAAILYKKEMAEKLALAKKIKSVAKLRVVNHIAATHPDIEQRGLHIVEGLSALGSILAVRDPKTIGGYPLKGKVLNTRDMKPVDILKNKEIFELLSIIGLEFGKPAENLNYGMIKIMTDQDVDGSSIQCLLLNLFSNWPELFSQGRIYRVMTPLYVCTKGKNTEVFYNKTEYDKFNSKGWEVAYCKGLGTLSKEAYKKCIMEPYLIKLSADAADFDSLEMAFGGSADKRKNWMLE